MNTPAKTHLLPSVKTVYFPSRSHNQTRETESSSRPMSPIISRRAEREDSEEMTEERVSRLYSVFFMAMCIVYSFNLFCFFVSDAKIQPSCANLRHKMYFFNNKTARNLQRT